MEKMMRVPRRKRFTGRRTAPWPMNRSVMAFSSFARCNPAGPDRMVPAPSPTRKHLLGRLSLPLVLLSALVVLSSPAPARAEVTNPHGVAVIIGNTDYEHRDVPDVTFAHRDADAFRRYVVEVLGYHPRNIVDLRDATRRELFDALGTKSDPRSLLWSYLDPDGASEVVVFYSGHGVPGVNDKRGYLLPVDADPKAAEDDGYPIDLLYRNVGGLAEARSVRVYLDACFSGGSGGGGTLIQDASPVFVEATLPEGLGEKVTSLAAAMGKQVASWDEGARHGLFTHHLLDALYGKADADGDGKVTAREVKGYLDRYMTRAARRQHRRIQQASLVGAAEVVVASAGTGGAFPQRPGLGETESADEAPVAELKDEPAPSPEEVEQALGLTHGQKELVQHGLAWLGYEIGRVDGVLGRRSQAAILAYQKEKGLPETGRLTAEVSEALQVLGKRQVEKVRAAGRRHEEEARRRQAEAVRKEQERALREPGRQFRDCDGTWCPEMVVVSAGSYMMGSPESEARRDNDEGPRHRVRIAEPFAVGVYEVTFDEWDACRRGDGCTRNPDDSGWGRGRRPVIDVSWADAQAYVKWLSRETGEAYRLLSESEWEYMARAGTTGPFHFGATLSTAQANYNGSYTYGSGRKGRYRKRTEPVGSFPANAFGVHDVHGNVSEWVEDCWHRSYAGAPADGRAWTVGGDCGRRVLRGGSWYYDPRYLRSAYRSGNPSGYRFNGAGFRVARTLD